MNDLTFVLFLDQVYSAKLGGFYLYRSEETAAGEPVIGGLYIQRNQFEADPPIQLRLHLSRIAP